MLFIRRHRNHPPLLPARVSGRACAEGEEVPARLRARPLRLEPRRHRREGAGVQAREGVHRNSHHRHGQDARYVTHSASKYCENRILFVILLDNDQVSQRQICHNIQTFYTNICIDNRHNRLLLTLAQISFQAFCRASLPLATLTSWRAGGTTRS